MQPSVKFKSLLQKKTKVDTPRVSPLAFCCYCFATAIKFGDTPGLALGPLGRHLAVLWGVGRKEAVQGESELEASHFYRLHSRLQVYASLNSTLTSPVRESS